MDNKQKSTSRDVELLEYADESGKGKDGVDVQLALEGTMLEHETSVRRAAKSYWKGIIFSMLISLSIIMRAYDIEIVGSFALPACRCIWRASGRQWKSDGSFMASHFRSRKNLCWSSDWFVCCHLSDGWDEERLYSYLSF